jgi:hypothetical protein
MAKKNASILADLGEVKEAEGTAATKENLSVEQEIECPRCHDIITLQSQLDNPI